MSVFKIFDTPMINQNHSFIIFSLLIFTYFVKSLLQYTTYRFLKGINLNYNYIKTSRKAIVIF